jgi:hypothetical protein
MRAFGRATPAGNAGSVKATLTERSCFSERKANTKLLCGDLITFPVPHGLDETPSLTEKETEAQRWLVTFEGHGDCQWSGRVCSALPWS